jgi:hypothetical protein
MAKRNQSAFPAIRQDGITKSLQVRWAQGHSDVMGNVVVDKYANLAATHKDQARQKCAKRWKFEEVVDVEEEGSQEEQSRRRLDMNCQQLISMARLKQRVTGIKRSKHFGNWHQKRALMKRQMSD